MTFSLMTLSVTVRNVLRVSSYYAEYHYSQRHYAEYHYHQWHYAEYHYDWWHYAEYPYVGGIMLSNLMLVGIMLRVFLHLICNRIRKVS
jgi:hypothetical protein